MSRLAERLSGGGKLIGFLVGGHPNMEDSYKDACAVIGEGVDVLEVGLPFSDPIADGPTIQAAATQALKKGMNPARYFKLCTRISAAHDVPLVCLTYYNIVLQYGHSRFAASCKKAGVDGVIIPDLPLEHSGPFQKALAAEGVDFIFLVSETTTEERLARICKKASGFIYVVALLGTTGARSSVDPALKKLLGRIRKHASIPLAVGFGISKPSHIKQVLSFGAQAAIVGSAIVKRVGKRRELRAYVASLRRAAR